MYDPQQSTRLNYGRTYLDLHITSEGLSITACPAMAGAIASFKIASYECIFGSGHGAAMGWNIHPSPPGVTPPPPSGSELYNPTQHGQNADDYRNLLGVPPDPTPNSPVFYPQMHGPSTSLIDPASGGWEQGSDYFRSRTRMAYYVRSGWPSSYVVGTGAYPDSPHLDLSKYVIDSRYGFMPLGGWQVVRADGILRIDPGEPISPVFNTAFCVYLQPGFTRFWRVPIIGGRVDVTTATIASGFGSGDPIVASTVDGAYAFGLWSPSPAGVYSFHWAQVDDAPFQFQILQVTFYHAGAVGPGDYPYRVYIAAGNLDWVEWLLRCALRVAAAPP